MNPVDASSVEGGVNISTQALASEVFDATNTGQLGKIRDLVSDDFVDHGFPAPMPPGPDGYIASTRWRLRASSRRASPSQ